MSSSTPEHTPKVLSGELPNASEDSSGSTTPLQRGERGLGKSSVSRIKSPPRHDIVVYKDLNTVIDIYAGGPAPAKRYARLTGSTQLTRCNTASPPRFMAQKRYGSYEPAVLHQPATSKLRRSNSLDGRERLRPVSETNKQSSAVLDIHRASSRLVDNTAGLLPALPIAGSPGTPTFVAGDKTLFKYSDESSGDSDAESASPGSEYRPRVLRKAGGQATEPSANREGTPVPYATRAYHTPENRYPRPYVSRRSGNEEPSFPTPAGRRVIPPRDLTPTFF